MSQFLASLAVAACFAGGAAAQTPVGYFDGDRTLFTVDVPDFWSVRVGGPRVLDGPDGEGERDIPRLLALQPTTDDSVWMGFISPPNVATMAEAREYLRDVARFLSFEPEVSPFSQRTIAGRSAEVLNGTGRRNGRDIQFTVALIDLPGDRIAVVSAVVAAGADPEFFDDINGVFASFRAGG